MHTKEGTTALRLVLQTREYRGSQQVAPTVDSVALSPVFRALRLQVRSGGSLPVCAVSPKKLGLVSKVYTV